MIHRHTENRLTNYRDLEEHLLSESENRTYRGEPAERDVEEGGVWTPSVVIG